MHADSQRHLIWSAAAAMLTMSAVAAGAAKVATTLTISGISGSILAQAVNINCADNGTISATVKGAAIAKLSAIARDGKSIQSITVAMGPAGHPTTKYQLTNTLITGLQQTSGSQPQEIMQGKFEKCSVSIQGNKGNATATPDAPPKAQ
jgi:hypothetical protein